MTKQSTDLNDAAAPEEILAILRAAAAQANESCSELQSAWTDKNAGKPWAMIAKELERCAARIEARLP